MSSPPTRASACFGEPPLRALVDQAEAHGRMGDGDIVGNRKIGKQRQFLENTGDARRICCRGAGE